MAVMHKRSRNNANHAHNRPFVSYMMAAAAVVTIIHVLFTQRSTAGSLLYISTSGCNGVQPPHPTTRPGESSTREVSAIPWKRRDLVSAASIVVGFSAGDTVHAEDVPGFYPGQTDVKSTAEARINQMHVLVGSDEELAKELQFWTDVCHMAVFSDELDKNGKRMVRIGFGKPGIDVGSTFTFQFSIDPSKIGRPMPPQLDWDTMQPKVDSFNFVQIPTSDRTWNLSKKVRRYGGSSIIGDVDHLVAESPHGLSIRFVRRSEEGDPRVDLIGFNVEVPALDPVSRFYQRAFGLKKQPYPADYPSVGPRSVHLVSSAGGVGLVLTPVPDNRVRDRSFNRYSGVGVVSSDTVALKAQVEKAVATAEEEQKEKDELDRRLGRVHKEGTVAKPSLDWKVDGKPLIDDGVGNVVFISSSSPTRPVARAGEITSERDVFSTPPIPAISRAGEVGLEQDVSNTSPTPAISLVGDVALGQGVSNSPVLSVIDLTEKVGPSQDPSAV